MELEMGVEQIKSENGYFNISIPERTALDLIRYASGVGGLNHVATVLEELSEKIEPSRLKKLAQGERSLCYIQRLGFIMDLLGFENLTEQLKIWLTEKKPAKTVLDPTRAGKNGKFNAKWRVQINTDIETDIT
jgi:predicted transcriptional regulator of viral defense system